MLWCSPPQTMCFYIYIYIYIYMHFGPLCIYQVSNVFIWKLLTFLYFILLHLWILHWPKTGKAQNQSIYEICTSLWIILWHKVWGSRQIMGSTGSSWYMLIEFRGFDVKRSPPMPFAIPRIWRAPQWLLLLYSTHFKIQENDKSTGYHISTYSIIRVTFWGLSVPKLPAKDVESEDQIF